MNNFCKFLFLCLLCVVSCKEFVPVLIWDTSATPDAKQQPPALTQVENEEFTDYFMRRVAGDKPLVVVFTEENLSVEDFSWRDEDDNGAFTLLSNLTAISKSTVFFPAVHAPYKALRSLRKHGYSWELYNDDISQTLPEDEAIVLLVKLEDPDSSENRPDLLRSHDKQIAEIYSKLLSIRSHIVAVYTAHHSSWSEAVVSKRSKRDAAENNGPQIIEGESILIYTREPSLLMIGNKNISVTNDSIVSITKDNSKPSLLAITIKISDGAGSTPINLKLNFEGSVGDNWALNTIVYKPGESDELLNSSDIVLWAPPRQGRSCLGGVVTFTNGKAADDKIAWVFSKYQIQPFFEAQDRKFGVAVDCVEFFTSGIWCGIFVVFILLLIGAWGIIMIMDINTMDRFDDPKGKTITIAASE